MDFGSSSSKTNPQRPRKRADVHQSIFERARDGSAVTRGEELRKKSKIDRLSALPDNILTCNILSRLSLRDVMRTSVLSSKWRFIWKQIPHLDFNEDFFKSLKSFDSWHQEVKYINDIIDSILLHHSEHIERFSIHVTFSQDILERLHIEQWVHHAALKEVKHISLKNCMDSLTRHSIIDMPLSLFVCGLLRDLELHNFRFAGTPTEFDGFPSLQSCSLSQLHDLMDDEFEQLIRLCPLLHKLVLVECSELCILKVHAPNLNFLKIEFFNHLVFLTGDCPQLVELAIDSCLFFHDLLFHPMYTSDVRIPKEHPMLNSLRKLSVTTCIQVSGLTLLPTLGYFRNLAEVHFQIFEDGNDYLEQISEYDEYRYSQKRAIGETVADSAFPSLNKVHLDISSATTKEEAIMLVFLLNNAPSLNTLTVNLPYCPSNIHDKEFRNKVLDLQQIYEKVDIRMKIDKYRRDATCRGTNDEHGHRSYEHTDSSESSDYLGSDYFGSDDDALNEFKLFYANYSRYLNSSFHQ